MKMKRFFCILFLASAFVACDKWPNDPPLDGMWQLMEARHGAVVTDTQAKQVYWSMRRDILQLSSPKFNRCYAHYHHVGDSLKCYNFVTSAAYDGSVGDNNNWISPDNSLLELERWAIFPEQDPLHPERVCVSYRIVTINGERMQLVNTQDTLTFRRY